MKVEDIEGVGPAQATKLHHRAVRGLGGGRNQAG